MDLSAAAGFLTLADTLKDLSANPFVLALLIILATFILEDAATVTAALLAAGGAVPWGLVASA